MTEEGLTADCVLTTRVDTGSRESAIGRIMGWAEQREARSVCFAPVHTLMECFYHEEFRQIVNDSDLVLPDGMPVVWALRRLGHSQQERVDGSGTMLELCRQAAKKQWSVGLYGGHPQWLQPLQQMLVQHSPQLHIGYAVSPPFRPLTAEEDEIVCRKILQSGVRLLFVGLGCPKQECWMAQHRSRLNIPMLGVGAAFDFHSGRKRRAPEWLRQLGGEWFFRLVCEPGRLWRRYLLYNSAFLWHSRLLSPRKLRAYALKRF